MGRAHELIRIRRLTASGAARAIRESAGLSLSEAEAESGVHRTTIWRWEAGERTPHGEPAVRYLEFLDELSGVREENGHGHT